MATKRHPDESLDSMLKRFKREVTRAEIIKDLRKREFYVPRSEARRAKRAAAIRRTERKK